MLARTVLAIVTVAALAAAVHIPQEEPLQRIQLNKVCSPPALLLSVVARLSPEEAEIGDVKQER